VSAIANIACIWRQPGFDKGDRIWNSASTFRACVRACVHACVRIYVRTCVNCLASLSLSLPLVGHLELPSLCLSFLLSFPSRTRARTRNDAPGCSPSSHPRRTYERPMVSTIYIVTPLNCRCLNPAIFVEMPDIEIPKAPHTCPLPGMR